MEGESVVEPRLGRPKITVSEDTLRAYYVSHPGAFSQPVGALCLALRFETEARAQEWLQENRKSAEAGLSSSAILEKTELHLTPDAPVLEGAIATAPLLHLPDHSVFGPVHLSAGWAVIYKRSTETAPRPYEAVSSQVRSLLIWEQLDEEELRIAPELAKKFEVRDVLSFSKFGISGRLARPWKSGSSSTN